MVAEFLIVSFLPALLIAAAAWDLASYTIPNFLSAILIAGFVAFALAAGLALPSFAFHLAAGACGLLIGFALFSTGLIGGGDAKLFASVALWFGFNDLLSFALVASLFGGALTLLLLTLRRFPLPHLLANQGWALRLHDEKAGIPYGVALALGAIAILPQTEIFHLASAV